MKKKIDIQVLRSYLRANKLPLTVERAALFEVMISMKGPYSAEKFFKAALKQNAVHTKTTIYRVLPIFVKAGFVKETRLSNGRKRYETNR
jgi:Fe2+ or Zn2+ uptake regulation protein